MKSIPILLYHHVAPDREITPEGFRAQLQYLRSSGYQAYALSDLVQSIVTRKPLEAPGFVLTFDDGYLDNWLYVYPILKELGIPATMYLITDRVESHTTSRSLKEPLDTRTREREPGGFLSWSEAREMAASGLVEFGSHTRSHRQFKRASPYENLESELRDSKRVIEENLGTACRHLAWPWGDYESSWLPQVKAWGYASAATTRAGANVPASDPFALKRLSVRREDVSWLRSRLSWNSSALSAQIVGPFYGLDRRLKVWWNNESPYSHG